MEEVIRSKSSRIVRENSDNLINFREIEGCSFSDKPGEMFEGRENVNPDNNNDEESPGAQGEIDESSAALKKLLTTPTKGFSQLVFNESVPQDELTRIGDEELMPNLSPIKFYHKDQKRFESLDHSLSDDPGMPGYGEEKGFKVKLLFQYRDRPHQLQRWIITQVTVLRT